MMIYVCKKSESIVVEELMIVKIEIGVEEEEMCSEKSYVLIYVDKEDDWMMVGDVFWE